MQTKASFLSLIQELDGDIVELDRVLSRNRRAWNRIQNGADDPVDWGALGFTIHTCYGILENYCLRISKFFENNLDPSQWHKALIEKMTLEIPGVRPAFITDAGLKRGLIELLGFRHRIRNLYGEDLDPSRTSAIQATLDGAIPQFRACHLVFVEKLQRIAEAL